jgi:hypothetical protein
VIALSQTVRKPLKKPDSTIFTLPLIENDRVTTDVGL